ncbi:hypothetical protein ZWY2020_058281 [Hordeum vulgare]|nr:hypothetical protein ZWY2020_058281 [Hordeum vulgare]
MDDVLRYPKAYARLCRAGISGGVLDAFLPYVLQPHECVPALRANDMSEMFPVVDTTTTPTANPRGFTNLLWK